MKHSEFKIGSDFRCEGGKYRCTDIGGRTIAAIRIDSISKATKTPDGVIVDMAFLEEDASTDGWFNGPPYAVLEIVFDEEDQKACTPA